MWRLILVLMLAMAAAAQASEDALQRAFVEAMQELQAGNLVQAERILREMLKTTDSPRVKLELARVFYLQGRLKESKALFQEVSMRADTPWRVRDNIGHFVREIEERTGYLKFGITVVSDSNPRSLAAQKEFSIGGLLVTPTEAPKKETGLRYSARGWMPFERSQSAGYLTASYTDFPSQDLDRLTLDVGVVKNLSESGRARIKTGIELGTFGGKRLYHFPYLGMDAVLSQSQSHRVAGDVKVGKVHFPDFSFLKADYASTALSLRSVVTETATTSLSGSIERSSANESPYSYYGGEIGPGVDTFWPGSTYLVGARASIGARKYDASDPLFGTRRSDTRGRLEASVGNKRWRFRDSYISLVATLERNQSNIGFFSYRKANLSMVIE
jgi:hypothetical protein